LTTQFFFKLNNSFKKFLKSRLKSFMKMKNKNHKSFLKKKIFYFLFTILSKDEY